MKGFRPGVMPTLVVFALLPLLLWLGCWQLQRADEKSDLLSAVDARRQAPPLAIAEVTQQPALAYQRLRLHGRFDEQHSVLLDSRIRGGKAGVELLQPFYDQSSGIWLLVNRGWIAWPDRRVAPVFTTPSEPLTVQAWVYRPMGESFVLKQSEGSGWPRLINQVDVTVLWQQLGLAGAPFEVRLEPGPASYEVDWPVVAMGPEKHTAYAVQWFALALALLILFIYFGWHNSKESKHDLVISAN